VSWWWFPARRRRDLDEEIEAHLRMAVCDRAERGESLAEARTAVAKEFGNVPLVKDVTRAMWGWGWLERARQGPEICAAATAEVSGVHDRRCGHAGLRHWREHGDF